MSKKLASGSGWDLRLHKNGRFACVLNMRAKSYADGEFFTFSSFTGKDFSEVFGSLLRVVTDQQLVEVRAAMLAAGSFEVEARQMQRRHADALRAIQAAARSARLAAAVAVVFSNDADAVAL